MDTASAGHESVVGRCCAKPGKTLPCSVVGGGGCSNTRQACVVGNEGLEWSRFRARVSLGHRRRGRRVCKHGAQQSERASERLQQGPTTSQGARDKTRTREEEGQSAARGRGVPRACGVGRSWQRAIGRVEDLCSPDRRAVLEGGRVHGCVEWEPGVRAAEGGRRTAVVVSNQASRSS